MELQKPTKKLNKFREPINIFPQKLSASEQDIFALILCEISKIVGYNKKKAEGEGKPIPTQFVFTEKELVTLFGCSKDNIRMTLEPAARKLQNTQIGYSSNDRFEYFSPIAYVSYIQGQSLSLEVSPTIAERLATNVVSGFSEMDFRLFVKLSGKYERRLLKLLSQWKGKKEIKLSIKEFREHLGIPSSSYKLFSNLRRSVIEPAFNDIISKSNGVWVACDRELCGFELVKTGKTYTDIIFKVDYISPTKLLKNNHLLSLTSDDQMLINRYEIIKAYDDKDVFPFDLSEIKEVLNNQELLENQGYEFNQKWMKNLLTILTILA